MTIFRHRTFHVYSKISGEFEFFFLENGQWNSSTLIPKGKVSGMSGKLKIDWTPAFGGNRSMVEAYSLNGGLYAMYQVNTDEKL